MCCFDYGEGFKFKAIIFFITNYYHFFLIIMIIIIIIIITMLSYMIFFLIKNTIQPKGTNNKAYRKIRFIQHHGLQQIQQRFNPKDWGMSL